MTCRWETWLLAPSSPLADAKANKDKSSKSEESGGKRKAQPVRNLNMESRFEDFKTGIANNKFNDVIKKVGAPPTVKRGGQDVQMCVSYHLRGTCFDTCSCKADHGPHSKDENDELYAWCKKAFE